MTPEDIERALRQAAEAAKNAAWREGVRSVVATESQQVSVTV